MESLLKVDVHMCLAGDERVDWLQQAVASLATEPVNLFQVPAIKGNTAKARSNGFSYGYSPYVSFVDPDDYVLPGAFAACLAVLETNPQAVAVATGYEQSIDRTRGVTYPDVSVLDPCKTFIHQLVVMRRSAVVALLPLMRHFPMGCEQILYTLLGAYGTWLSVPVVGYHWRVHSSGAHTTGAHLTAQQKVLTLKKLMQVTDQ